MNINILKFLLKKYDNNLKKYYNQNISLFNFF